MEQRIFGILQRSDSHLARGAAVYVLRDLLNGRFFEFAGGESCEFRAVGQEAWGEASDILTSLDGELWKSSPSTKKNATMGHDFVRLPQLLEI